MGLFSTNKDDVKSVEELNQELQEKENELKKVEGERRLEALKKEKQEKIEEKKSQVKKEKFKQSKAGKVIDTLGEELGKLAEKNDSQKAEQLSKAAEQVDGDGKDDTGSALGIGLEKENKARDIEVEGNLEVEGDIVSNDSRQTEGDEISFVTDEENNNSTGIF